MAKGKKKLFHKDAPGFTSALSPEVRAKTERTSTVFSGTADEWVPYMEKPWHARRTHPLSLDIELHKKKRTLKFPANNDASRQWSTWLEEGVQAVRQMLDQQKQATRVLNKLLFDNVSNTPLHLHATEGLPAEATREVRFDDELNPIETDIVLQGELLEDVGARMKMLKKKASPEERLGTLWPVLRRVLSQLGYPSYPRDRFKDRIVLTEQLSFLTVQLLFDGKKRGRLLPNQAGDIYMNFVAEQMKVSRKHVEDLHPYFRMLNAMSFVVREEQYKAFRSAISVVVRDYLDQLYLRISLAGVMPGLMTWMMPMTVRAQKGKRVDLPKPSKGKYGILDADDLAAWRKVREPLEDNGFAIVRQLGMGQFGRVYEAINTSNGAMPARVAVKVDRIRKGHKKEVIQAVETIMDISRDLAESPHIIRVYDAGRLKPLGFTYHVLQLVDGDTLDNLIGVTGEEHSSVLRPQVARTDLQHLRADYLKAIHHGGDEAWRRERVSLPFVDPLSLPQALDVLTSTLLWLEETHALGYAVNDLKNGNLMISRRGQFKAIDLDAFSPIQSTLDMLPDYFFLAVTLLLFVLRVMDGGKDSKLKAQGLLTDPAALHKTLTRLWRFGDLAELTDGRVHSSEVIEWMVSCMDRCRNGSFAHDPKAFSACIDQLIHIKRRLTQEEMILD